MFKLFKKTTLFLSFLAILYASYLLLLLSIPYLNLKPNTDFLGTKQLIYHIKLWRFSFYTHVFTSIFCIVAGLFQFVPLILRRFPTLHRLFGFIYIGVVLLFSGPSGLIMSFYANGGMLAKMSFVILSILWIVTSFIAFMKVKNGKYQAHGAWMLRSYALTLSAVSLRLYAYIFDFMPLNFTPIEEYTLLAWISWIPNLIFAEWMIKRGFVEQYFQKSS